TNGTIFYDLDAKTRSVIHDFSSVASGLPNKFVRVAARYQNDGTLVAIRVFTSTSFNSVWLNPEGHVLHMDTTNNVLTVENEDGQGVAIDINSTTNFYFRTPSNLLSATTPLGTGTAFLTNLK